MRLIIKLLILSLLFVFLAAGFPGTVNARHKNDANHMSHVEHNAGLSKLTDTLHPADTLQINDTLQLNGTLHPGDTLQINDTLQLNGTLHPGDTLQINDTLQLNGTLHPGDTLQINDTIPAKDVAPDEEIAEEPRPSYWAKGLHTAANFSQISLSNWTTGGQNSVSLTSFLNAFINYKTPDDRFTWENSLDLGYGLINQEHRRTVKSDDKIDFSTKFGRRASETWSYSTLLNFRTQFAPGFKSPGDTLKISNFMAPGYLNLSFGMNHQLDQHITLYMSPLAGRIVYLWDEELDGSFGVEAGENKRYEFGGFIRVQFRANLMDNISVNSKLELFSNYLDKPKNFDVNAEARITMQITRFIAANILLQAVYNENARVKLADGTELGPRLQLKQVFGLGFSYRF